ncbi:prepilin-type N-terminal cleavage/methylation domain-containing protein [Brevibacillus sp. GCM10020057]|uniref:type IV pilus modification PilV family protein n=1 Tax=Brevibacillus sp. GCM10020057 TaxID=3317327 RepID=UPI0036285134
MKALANEKGLSLIEVVASLLILSVALMFLSQFLVRSFAISGNQDNRQVALNLARQTMEEWKTGNGIIPKDVDQEDVTLEEDFLEKPLSYQLLSDICTSTNQLSKDANGIRLADLSINDRTYQTYVLPQTIRPDSMKDNPLIRIVVKVFSNDAKDAELETLVPNPAVGQETDS